MPIYALDGEVLFPDPEHADPSGLIAVGGDLEPSRLLQAYASGIFPWYSEGQPILWHSPDPRFVLFPNEMHVSRSLRQSMRKGTFRVTLDEAFEEVIHRCAGTPRPDQDGTWITDQMLNGYMDLHQLGFAHSAEAWSGDVLVGGLYGVSLGSLFFGESMFADRSDASKVAFATLVDQLLRWDFSLIDSQVHTDHLERFGAVEISRTRYLSLLRTALSEDTRRGRWSLDSGDRQREAAR